MFLDVIFYALIIFIVMSVLLYGNGIPPSVIEVLMIGIISVVVSWGCSTVELDKNQPIEKRIGCVEFTVDHVARLEYRDAAVAAKEYYVVKPNEYGITRLEFEQVKPRIIDGKVYASLYLVAKNNTFSYHQEIRDVSCQIR